MHYFDKKPQGIISIFCLKSVWYISENRDDKKSWKDYCFRQTPKILDCCSSKSNKLSEYIFVPISYFVK